MTTIPTRLIYYAGGKIDFTRLPAERLAGRGYTRPFLVLLDKDDTAATASLSASSAELRSAAEVEESINWAWAAALMQAEALVC